jgi:hypothetical protein
MTQAQEGKDRNMMTERWQKGKWGKGRWEEANEFHLPVLNLPVCLPWSSFHEFHLPVIIFLSDCLGLLFV